MKKRWFIAAALVAGAACAETTQKDVNRNKAGNASQSQANARAPSVPGSYSQNDNEDDTLSSEDCDKPGEAP